MPDFRSVSVTANVAIRRQTPQIGPAGGAFDERLSPWQQSFDICKAPFTTVNICWQVFHYGKATIIQEY